MSNGITQMADRYFQCIKSFESGSSKLSAWSLSIFGGSLLVIISDSYLRPADSSHRIAYFLFLVGWLFIGLSLYFGFLITRYVMVLDLHSMKEETLEIIFKNCNAAFRKQMKYFQWGLLIFGCWLVLYLLWWIFTDIPITK